MGRAATGSTGGGAVEEGGEPSGVFGYDPKAIGANGGPAWRDWPINFDISRAWGAEHTGDEFRGVNASLLFCIKHD
jgi:hypothetical protein